MCIWSWCFQHSSVAAVRGKMKSWITLPASTTVIQTEKICLFYGSCAIWFSSWIPYCCLWEEDGVKAKEAFRRMLEVLSKKEKAVLQIRQPWMCSFKGVKLKRAGSVQSGTFEAFMDQLGKKGATLSVTRETLAQFFCQWKALSPCRLAQRQRML